MDQNIKSVIDRGRITRSGITYLEYGTFKNCYLRTVTIFIWECNYHYYLRTVAIFITLSLYSHMGIGLNP